MQDEVEKKLISAQDWSKIEELTRDAVTAAAAAAK